MEQVRSIVKRIFDLKPLSPVMKKVMMMAPDQDSSIYDVAEIILYDPVLTTNVLIIVNSSYFGLKQKINSVHQACVHIGMNQIVDLVLLTSSAENLTSAHTGYDIGKGELWKNSVSSALIARQLAEKKINCDVHLVFTTALIKDIDKSVLSQNVADAYAKINALVTERGYAFEEAEKRVIGIDYAELGAMVAKTWGFSHEMQDFIRNHHQPRKASICAIETSIVFMADALCMMMGIGVGSDGLAYRFDQHVAGQLQIGKRGLEQLIAESSEKRLEVEALLGMA